MGLVSGNRLNRFWKKGVKPIKDAIGVLTALSTVDKETLVGAINELAEGKFDVAKLVASTNITEPGFAMDGKTASEAITELYSKINACQIETAITVPQNSKITTLVLNEITARATWGFCFIGVINGGDVPSGFDYATGIVTHTGNTCSVVLFSRRNNNIAINSYSDAEWTGWKIYSSN